MKKNSGISIIIISLLFLSNVAFGQRLGVGRLMVGGSFLNLSSLDDVLADRGHSAVGNNFLTVGLGYEQFFNRVSLGIDSYNFMIRGDYNYQDYFRPQVNYHYALAKAGWILFRKEQDLIVYPTVGIGGGRVGIRLVDLDEGQIKRGAGYGGIMEMALNVRRYRLLEGETKYHMELGASLGYMRTVGGNWTVNGLTNDATGLIASPDAAFFRVTLGIGKFKN
ncbi:MAG: hypothetical protein MRZ79_14270 [Bacteroidia bacterium]|nr:hypothetical protein [Bacteroidia bacterium]